MDHAFFLGLVVLAGSKRLSIQWGHLEWCEGIHVHREGFEMKIRMLFVPSKQFARARTSPSVTEIHAKIPSRRG